MGSPDPAPEHNTTTTTATSTMSRVTAISCLLASNLATSLASVAVGLGQINPDNSGECLDPDTGLAHPLGSSWAVAGCGEASCDLRQGTVFMSYSYCGATHAEEGCYLKRDVLMPYPYCCPRSFCPTNTFTDIISNSLDTVLGNDPEEELQMAADSSLQQAGAVLQYEALDTADTADSADYYDWDQIFADYSRGAF